jgi:hypothetical protein
MGINKIKAGDLEVGLYYFAMAETIGPLDSDVQSWISWAKEYQYAAMYYGIDWQKAAEKFHDVMRDVPNLVDSSGMTAKQRYTGSLEGYGDVLMGIFDYCNAATQYQTAKDVFSTEELVAKLTQAQEYCTNPPATPTPDPNATATP